VNFIQTAFFVLGASLFSFLPLVKSSTALAQDEFQDMDAREMELTIHDKVGTCVDVSDSILRLQCYDKMAAEMGMIAPDKTERQEQKLATFGFWKVLSSQNALGEELTYLKIYSNAPVKTMSGIKKEPEFVIRCKLKKTDVYLDWKGPLSPPHKEKMFLSYKIDELPKVSTDWELSLDKFAAFSPEPIEFVRSLKDKKNLLFEFTPLNETVKTVAFTLDGLDNALDMLVQRCYN
jgi:hypothetical protein